MFFRFITRNGHENVTTGIYENHFFNVIPEPQLFLIFITTLFFALFHRKKQIVLRIFVGLLIANVFVASAQPEHLLGFDADFYADSNIPIIPTSKHDQLEKYKPGEIIVKFKTPETLKKQAATKTYSGKLKINSKLPHSLHDEIHKKNNFTILDLDNNINQV